jgi:hypothetical protein
VSLFFESAFGICLGCNFHPLFFKETARYCPGEVCDVRAKQDVQRTSSVQMLILVGFAAYLSLVVYALNDSSSKHPDDLFGISGSTQAK